MTTTTKAERGKTQIEVTEETRRKLRMLAAIEDVSMAEAADEAIQRALDESRQELAPVLHLRVVQEGGLIADLPEWPYPVPRVGDYFFHPPGRGEVHGPVPEGTATSPDRISGCVLTVAWRVYDRSADPEATSFVMTSHPYVELTI